MKKSAQQRAKLRTCASCEWIFQDSDSCPRCGFVSYGARYVYGDLCYSYKLTQKPWKERKLFAYEYALDRVVKKHPYNEIRKEDKND